MISNSKHSNQSETINLGLELSKLDRFAEVGNELAAAAGEVIRKYFRKSFHILDKEDSSPVTIADQAAEESMVSIIQENFPSHTIHKLALTELRWSDNFPRCHPRYIFPPMPDLEISKEVLSESVWGCLQQRIYCTSRSNTDFSVHETGDMTSLHTKLIRKMISA